MKVQSRQSFNQERKANYARMSREGDKEQRNAELSAALGEGSANLKAKAKFITVYTAETYINDKGKEKTRRVSERRKVIPDRVVPAMPGASLANTMTKAAKRAARKAKANRLVSDHGHPLGRCGNIGCRGCNPLMNRKPSYAP